MKMTDGYYHADLDSPPMSVPFRVLDGGDTLVWGDVDPIELHWSEADGCYQGAGDYAPFPRVCVYEDGFMTYVDPYHDLQMMYGHWHP